MRTRGLAPLLVVVGCTGPSSPPPPPPAPVPATAPAAPAAPVTPIASASRPAVRPPARWVALGDSYTKGEAARAEEAWPAVATERLRASGRPVELVANLGRTGWTSRDVLEKQVPRLGELEPDFVTVQVGINDLVQGFTEDKFRASLRALLDAVVARVPGRVIAVTIPDFSVARAAPRFGDPEQLHADIAKRNAIIVEEAKRANVPVADIFERSRDAANDPALLAKDGIHPSAAGYAAWVPVVLPALEKLLDDRK